MRYSVEVYPEESPARRERLMQTLASYAEAYPIAWASVTCSKRRLGPVPTIELARDIQRNFGWPTAPHLTGRGHGWADLKKTVALLKRSELTSVVAIRGDGSAETGEPFPTGSHLVAGLREIAPDLNISAACYPERHPESQDDRDDLAALRAKTAAGARDLITQFVLQPGILTSFMQKLRGSGIQTPVIAGVLVPTETERINRLAERCGVRRCERYDDSTFQTLCAEAEQAGYAGVHLFTLNQPLNPMKGALHASL